MLRRQRTFFLTQDQYESVLLEYAGLNYGRQIYTFHKEEPDVDNYTIWARISNDSGYTWGEWYSSELTITENPAVFSFPFAEGSMCEVYVVVTGDGSKDPSDPSNIITAITPVSPAYPDPVIEGFVFYIDGSPVPAIKPLEIPSGVSSWVVWHREIGQLEWSRLAFVSGGAYGYFENTETAGKTYQYIIAWYDRVNNKLLSDISNIVTIALPQASTTTLLPPKNLSAYFYGEYEGHYYNALLIQRGDMRATSVLVEYKRSTVGQWTNAFEYVFSDNNVGSDTKSYYITPMFADAPITGEVWQYRMKNKANGYATSDYSDLFVITIPSFLPKLDTPTISLAQNGASVIVSWNPVSNAAGYKIERRLNSASSFTVLGSVSASASSFEDYGTSLGNTYVYRVTALGDNQFYQDSSPAQASITITNIVILEAPVIDSVTETGIDIVLVISNIDAPNTGNVDVEMSENNGSWVHVAYSGAPQLSATSVTVTADGTKILNGGNLRFRARALPEAMAHDPSPWSEIASITIDEREWLLRWNGSSWEDPSGLTGGWYSPDITFSDGVIQGNVQQNDLGDGTLRLQGTGYCMTRNALTSGRIGLNTIYKKICMIGTLIKQVDGSSNHAWFGSGHTYTFAGGINIEVRSSYYTFAGGESGRAAAGTKTDPFANACAQGTYITSTGSHVFFRFYNGYADIRGIYGIKQ